MSTQFIDINGLKSFKQKQDVFNEGKFLIKNDYVDTETGIIKSSKLPSYVDDIIDVFGIDVTEGEPAVTTRKFYIDAEQSVELTADAAEKGKIYVDVNSNKQYRTTGSAFVAVSDAVSIADKALKDINGNQIDTTYATKDELNNASNTLVVSVATYSTAGVVKIGDNITVDSDGTIAVSAASSIVAGVVKIGDGITYENGTISIAVANINDIFGSNVITEGDAAGNDDIDSLFD
ncbi:MAG: hypothetical protein IJ797_03585 [Selenomonadaceae bacterium]|nr:hypothetical protein [Selenomonadaceae bacterium]